MNERTQEVIRTVYSGQPKRIAKAIVDISGHIEQPSHMDTGQHGQLVKSVGLCLETSTDPLSCLLEIVEAIIGVFIRSPKQLVRIVEEIDILEKKTPSTQNKYTELAKTYIREVYLSSRGLAMKMSRQEELISRIKKEIQENNRIAKEQSKLLDTLRSGLKENDQVDETQSVQINALETEVKRQQHIDAEQKELLQALDNNLKEKSEIDQKQTELIEEIRREFERKTNVDSEQSALLHKIEQLIEEKTALDDNQTRNLLKLKEELIEKTIQDLEQSHAIDHLEVIAQNLHDQMVDLQKKLGIANQFAVERDRRISLHKRLIVTGGIVLFVIQLITICVLVMK